MMRIFSIYLNCLTVLQITNASPTKLNRAQGELPLPLQLNVMSQALHNAVA